MTHFIPSRFHSRNTPFAGGLGWLAIALLVCTSFASEQARAEESEGKASASEVAKQLADPNTSLGFMAFQLDYVNYQGNVRRADSQSAVRLNFQPSLPYPIAKGVNFFARPLIPIVLNQPVPDAGGFEQKGVDLGDISFDTAIGKGWANGVTVIGGMVGSLPTSTDSDLGAKKVLLGPEALLGQKTSWGFYGLLVTQLWDAAGDTVSNSVTGGQYFYTIDLPDAWQIQAQPTWSFDHKADKDKLTFPLGTGMSKTLIFGKMPVKFSLQYWYYVASSDAFGANHQIRFQVAPVVPLPW